jgi:hypothetical protein
MNSNRHAIWRFVAGPMTVCGLFSVAIVYWISGSVPAAALAGVGCLALGASIAVALVRALDDAVARIRHAGDSLPASSGVFGSLVAAATESRLRAESTTRETARAKTELEATASPPAITPADGSSTQSGR